MLLGRMITRRLLLLCIIISLMIALTASLSILMVESLTSFSHHIFAMSLVKGLLQKGHHVYMVSITKPNFASDLAQNLTYDIEDMLTKLKETNNTVYNFVDYHNLSSLQAIYFTYWWCRFGCEKITQAKGGKKILQVVKHKKFDVIVQDVVAHQCLYGLWEIAKGKPPIVGFVTFAVPWLNSYIGGPHYPTVRPHMYALRPTTLWERTLNALYYVIDDNFRYYNYMRLCQRVAEQYVGHKLRPLHEIEKTMTIVLLNTHPTFDDAIPLPPNVLEIGGMHAQAQSSDEAEATYPKNIRKFLDEAENGVILIAFGTNVKWKHMGMDNVKLVAHVLPELKQRVLWKIDGDIQIPIMPNVMTVTWFPQNEILDHENVKAIWTHGGLLGIQEAIWKGVPVIVTPFCFDQRYNMDILVAKGLGICLHFEALSRHSLLNTFEQIVYNKSYIENMKEFSKKYRDRPVPPLDLAIWGIEYAARNSNSSLVSPIKFQSWIEQNMIDVYVILVLILCVLLLICVFVTNMIRNCLCKNVNKFKQM